MKLIDKDALVEEIEKRRDLYYKYYMKNGAGSIAECKYDEDREILSFINTLEVKEMTFLKKMALTLTQMKQRYLKRAIISHWKN